MNPLVVPHIVIHEAPDQHPYELDHVRSPWQCCNYGNSLTHPNIACYGHCCLHNYYSTPIEENPPSLVQDAAPASVNVLHEAECTSDSESEDETETETETELSTDSESTYSSDTLMTPQDEMFMEIPAALVKHEAAPQPKASFYLDEDEDDLPPFDDWYQSIAQRATV